MSTLRQDDLYARFEILFMEFFGSPASFEIVIEPDEFRPLFYHSWEQKVLPSKEILVKAVHIQPTSFVSLEEIGDHVLSTFAMALEKLRIEEHTDTSLPQEPQQKPKLGRKPNPKMAVRRRIVGNHIREKEDFDDEDKLKLLLQELDRKEIPPPEDKDRLLSFTGSWEGLLKEPGTLATVVKVLNRDRWSRKKAT